jgi:hypothetical protein
MWFVLIGCAVIIIGVFALAGVIAELWMEFPE